MSEQPGLWRRCGRTGVGLLVVRLILGGVFIWMGLAKTGLIKMALVKTNLIETTAVATLVDKGLLELADPVDFLKLIREYRVVPENVPLLMNLPASVLPWVEVLCGLLLITGVAVRGTALLLVAMLIGFTALVAVRAAGIYHTEQIPFCAIKFDCGCGAGEVYICHKLLENAALCLLALLALVSRSRRFCLLGDLVRSRSAPTG